jgi:general secretion pathway protein K
VAAILDWRSGSSGPTLFDQYYSTIAPTFRARHASFQEIEELLLVRGMTPELYYGNYVADSDGRLFATGGLRDCFSVWGSQGPFDINAASPALMAAVGMQPDTVRSVAERRRIRPLHDLGEVGGPAPRMGVGGNVIWTLRATARLRDSSGRPSETIRTASATVKLLDRRQNITPLHVLRWYDDAWSQGVIAPLSASQLLAIPPGVPRP